MRFHFGQFVTRNDDLEIGIVGRIVRVESDSIRVCWPNGYISNYSEVQLRVVCPTCMGLTKTFSTEQCARQKKECDICNPRKTT